MTGALLAVAAALFVWPAPGRAGARLPAPPDRRGSERWRLLARSPWAAAAVAGALTAVLSSPLVAVLAAVCAGLGSRVLDRRRRSSAADARLLAFAEALGVLAAELRAGRALADAAAAATAACPDPAARDELAFALRGTTAAGAAFPTTPDLRGVTAAVELSLRTGCSLAAVSTALEDDLRARHRHRLELRTATAGPAASAVVLAGLPVLGLAMGAGIGAHPWRVLTTTGPGQVLLVAGVLLELAGVAWVGRLTRRVVPGPAGGDRRA